jgi:predicted methyltransferase
MKIKYVALLLLMAGPIAAASEYDAVRTKIQAAMQADVRTEQDTARDANRMPIETLEFFGLRDDMRVIELMPGGGWYTKLLAPVLADNGEFYISIGADRLAKGLASTPGFAKMELAAPEAGLSRAEGSRFYDLNLTDFGVEDADIVFTFRNYHNFSVEGRMKMNEKVFDALKPGGIYAVVDHTRRHMEPASGENGRRVDPVLAIKEIQDSGFEFVDYATMHYREVDALELEVGKPNVTGKTDRWTLKFRKPM